MNQVFWRGRLASLLLATLAAGWVPGAAHAQRQLDVGVYTGASCSPGPYSSGMTFRQATDQCSIAGQQSAEAAATFTKLKVFAATGPDNLPGAQATGGAAIFDGAIITPTDASLVGSRGIYSIRLHVDGTLSPGARVFVGGYSMLDMESYIEQRLAPSFQQGFSADWGGLGVGFVRAGYQAISADGSLTVLLPMLFGEKFYYQLGITAIAEGQDQTASFFNTAMITGVEAFTNDNPFGDGVVLTSGRDGFGVLGRKVGFTVASQSGIDMVAESASNLASLTPVPEPQTWLLLLSGLAVVSGWARRRAKS